MIIAPEDMPPAETQPHAPMAAGEREGRGSGRDGEWRDGRPGEREMPHTHNEFSIYTYVRELNRIEGARAGWGWRYREYRQIPESAGRPSATYVVAFNDQHPTLYKIVANENDERFGPMPVTANIIPETSGYLFHPEIVASTALEYRRVFLLHHDWETQHGFANTDVRAPTRPMTEGDYVHFMQSQINQMNHDMNPRKHTDAGHGTGGYQHVSYTPGSGERAGLPFSDVAPADALTAVPNVRHNHSNQAPTTRRQPPIIT